MPLKRTKHWATREFSEFLKARKTEPFAWGKHDCALFAADGILAMTGTDIAAEFRGKYTDEAGALAAIKAVTGTGTTVADAAAWCAEKAAMVELQHPLMAQRGDLVIIRNGSTQIAGLVHLSGRHVVSVGPRGPVRLDVITGGQSNLVRAWRV